jgi:hypothetical protein
MTYNFLPETEKEFNDSIDYFDHCCNEFAQVSILLGESNLAFTIGSHEIRNRLEAIL